MVEIWNKKRIENLSLTEKDQWFDVLNCKLEEDRNISLNDPKLQEKQHEIKNDYFQYIESCPYSNTFYKYYVLKVDNRIISVCRINVYDNKFLLEGLQTHKDYYMQGYAMKLLDNMIFDLKKDGIKTLFSEARTWNNASNNLQIKLGFTKYGQDDYNYLYKLNVDEYNGKNE